MTIAHTFHNETTSHPGPPNLVTGRRDVLSVHLSGGSLSVAVKYLSEGVVASDNESGMFGEGPQLGSAVKDLIEHLKVSLKDLEAHEDRLVPDLQVELQRLRFLFGK